MTETTYGRSRRAALIGLVLQVLAALGALALALYCRASALQQFAIFLSAGIPLWFVVVLVFRQHELAALEQMDLEELRRERERTGGGEALFDEGGAGFLVAKRRLDWMRKWLVPVFGLLSAAVLISSGVGSWLFLRKFATSENWPAIEHADIGLILVSLLVLVLFFYARYAAGLGRVREWQLLRGCGSFMLGTVLVGAAIVAALAYEYYQRGTGSGGKWEHYVAQAIPILMIILGIETVLNFVLDIYRPRAPGTEPRACFDSRLLGLISEPGGIAHSLQEAINYQFGFQVSQTWFYQLLERTLAPLIAVGALAVWLLTCIVIVQPYERVIVERFGRQLDPAHPLGPGIHCKWPAPFELARRYNTGQLHAFVVGFKVGDEVPTLELRKNGKIPIELWTDEKHDDREHFDFVTAAPQGSAFSVEGGTELPGELAPTGDAQRAPVSLVRMAVEIAYKIRDDKLADFTQHVEDPHRTIRRLAWSEVVEYAAASDYESLIGTQRHEMARVLRQRLTRRVEQMGLGLEIVYVGALQVHPVKQVAEAFRDVVNAQQEKLAAIRKARVEENKILSVVAGNADRARILSYALDKVSEAQQQQNKALEVLEAVSEPLPTDAFGALADLMTQRIEAELRLARARERAERMQSDFDLGLGQSVASIRQARDAVVREEKALADAEQALSAALKPVRARLAERLPEPVGAALVQKAEADAAVAFWTVQINRSLRELEGDAAKTLARAQASRWQHEMRTAAQVIRLQKEKLAYNAAPRVYKVRTYLDVLVDGLERARKYLLAFDPAGRDVRIRLEAQEHLRPGMTETLTQENLEPR